MQVTLGTPGTTSVLSFLIYAQAVGAASYECIASVENSLFQVRARLRAFAVLC